MYNLKRKLAILAAIGVVAVGTSVAIAYFTAGGSGTGTASVGVASNITLSATTAGNLYPNGPAQDVTITVTNPGAGAQFVNSVSLASVDASDAGCDATVFTMPTVPVNQNLAPGGSTTVTGQLSMADNGSNQDDCQGNSLTLNLTSN